MSEMDTVSKIQELEQKLAQLEKVAYRGDDYRQIVNAMMAHVYCYYAHEERMDLENFWVTSRDDIVYAHNERAYFGKKGVHEYYIDGTDGSKKRYGAYAKDIYNIDPPEGAAVGYRVIHILGSPFVEIADDRKTAQGVWMSFSFMSNMDSEGKANPSYILQRFSGEFLREDDGWKIWHVRDYTDVGMNIETLVKGPDEAERDSDGKPIKDSMPPMMGKGMPKDLPKNVTLNAEDGVNIRKMVFESSGLYQPWTVTVMEPHLPQPYESWNPEQTFIKIIKEHQDENSSFIIE